MNILKSVNVALAKNDMKKADLAKMIGMSPQSFSRLINGERCPSTTIESMARALGMSASEFIALGED